ncbi:MULTISPECIES: hypothetical protein [Bacillaceae]|jgi:hypothetical protein|uniref:hypothetical protein n=1 Tax=Bacillaceae TaxID=186817 RepID=UPI0004E22C21|nr:MULTISPECIES: hypothetical protein [Bacillaceae]MCM3364910.1 hypothetical protein [Niallia sp. MER TA 168]
MKKSKGVILGLALALLVAGGVTQAASKVTRFNVNVAPFNGSAYTGWDRVSGTIQYVESIHYSLFSVGGDYTVDLRAQRAHDNARTPWARNQGDNSGATWYTNYTANHDHYWRLEISNDLTTPVKVNVQGFFTTY